jgi:hypothetical protein
MVEEFPQNGVVERCAESFVWVGAVSFEERCLGSLRFLENAAVKRLVGAVAVDYPTRVEPAQPAEKIRQLHRTEMRSLVRGLSGANIDLDTEASHPYRLSTFRRTLGKALRIAETNKANGLIIDMTCITKVHTLALAVWLSELQGTLPLVTIAYTLPEQYGSPSKHSPRGGRWVETVLAPCILDPRRFSEEADGIVLLGHEGSRLMVALSQLEPREALVLLWRTSKREDLEIVCRTQNAKLLAAIDRGERPGWMFREMNYAALGEMETAIRPFVASTVRAGRRIVLYPFGPKPMILLASSIAIQMGRGAVWYCYPIPRSYDAAYSLGCGPTRWFRPVWAPTSAS